MKNERQDRVRDVFMEVVDLEILERAAALDDLCDGDDLLKQEVQALLLAESESGGFMAGPTFDGGGREDRGANVPESDAEKAGQVIDHYQLLERIGEGGFGTVWMADQQAPVRRKVALKIIKLGMDTKQVIARFDAERQALAMMDHHNIARVYDAGRTLEGRPYFVMEYIRGVPILEHSDRHELSVRDRLGLFISVCRGIEHAHQKGVIHRDIKPSNVLVSLRDGMPVPKVIDFGIAKATGAELTSLTLFTGQHQILGTPAYMSPEQADRSGAAVDTRSDVYSLGVLLYELLTGVTPSGIEHMRDLGIDEVVRVIREDDPPTPSTRLTSMGDGDSYASRRRCGDVKQLGSLLRDDLDWIVMRCLEKDPGRRYATVGALVADIERHLREEPVQAGPPTIAYRCRKFFRRHRTPVVCAALVFVALVAGVTGTSLSLALAVSEKERAEKAAVDAGRARQEEALKAKQLQQALDFQSSQLGRLFPTRMGDELRESIIDAAPPRQRESLRGALERISFTNIVRESLNASLIQPSIEAIQVEFGDDPRVEARLLQGFADVLVDLGMPERAKEPQGRALAIRRGEFGRDAIETLESLRARGLLSLALGDAEDAERRLLEVLERRRLIFGDDALETLESMNDLGAFYTTTGRYDRAEVYFRESLTARRRNLGENHAKTLSSIGNLATALVAQEKFEEAEEYIRQSLETRRRVLGDRHPDTLGALSLLSFLIMDEERLEEAERVAREALDGSSVVLGDDHTATLLARANLGDILSRLERFDEAEEILREGLVVSRRSYGVVHSATVSAFLALAPVLARNGKTEEADRLLDEFVAAAELKAESPSWLRAAGASLLGEILADRARFAEAEKIGLAAHRALERSAPPAKRGVLLGNSRDRLVRLYEAWGNPEKAARWRGGERGDD